MEFGYEDAFDMDWHDFDEPITYLYDQKFMDTLMWIQMLPEYKKGENK